jgi:thiol:disulfide interchange protein DsbC
MIRALAIGLLLAAGAAQANEAAIRKALQPKIGSAKIEGVQPAPLPGLWEVRIRARRGMQVLYTDAAGTFLIDGNIYDLRSDRNLTEERVQQLNAIKFESLPLDQAVKVQRGDGRRVVAMFSDPYCPYCQRFEKTLQQVSDITVYVFMYPVIRPQSADHSRAVWCSADRQKAWLDLALEHKPPPVAPTCDNPVDKNVELGQSIGVTGTPTLIFQNGERASGALTAPDLIAALDKASGKPAAKKRQETSNSRK